ncbi:DUF2510 domain-containing protein [Mycobacterium asiaticum]|uniref:DUF2510 domain-containing protein n=1 Tax=Mycobacterium asiaticum TaxID=1790 RepID=A0A1A3C9E2_MYCAS|nr:DUF2510 domain-containing protein [Mycobacterium asiaticum]OBI83665.1 hypothetical protein A9X01_20385 [Mycobacterium asiaticum]
MPTSPPAGWYLDPDNSGGQRYWDGARWTTHRRPTGAPTGLTARVRRDWAALPIALRVMFPLALVVALVAVGFAVFASTPRDDWARLPNRLSCRTESGQVPPPKITVSSVDVKHPRGSVLQLAVRFAEPLPPVPIGTRATRFVGYVLTYSVANNGTPFADLGPEPDTNDLAITSTRTASPGENRMRFDRDTNARITAPDTVEMLLDLNRFDVANQSVSPELTLRAQFNTPSTTTVQFAPQVCRA